MIQIIIGIIFILYDIALNCISPGIFLDFLTSFSHIWTFFGLVLIYSGLYRRKNGRFFFQSWKKRIKVILSSFLGLCFIISIINLGFIMNPRICSMDEPVDYMILLGGGIDKNGRLPPDVIKRVQKAADYLSIHPETKCVVSGGKLKWHEYAEAPELKNQLIRDGIDGERIFVEDQALDTIQNLEYSAKLISTSEDKSLEEVLKSSFVLISTRYHLRRAERLADRIGYENISGIGSKSNPFFIPQTYLREICAYVKLNARILLTGKPKNLQRI